MKFFFRHFWSALLACAVALLHIACMNSSFAVVQSIEWGVLALVISLQVSSPFFWWLLGLYPLILFWYSDLALNMYSIVFAATALMLWALHVYVLKEKHLLTRMMLVEVATVLWTVGIFGARLALDTAQNTTSAPSLGEFWLTLGYALVMNALLMVVWTSMEAFVNKKYEA